MEKEYNLVRNLGGWSVKSEHERTMTLERKRSAHKEFCWLRSEILVFVLKAIGNH